MNFKELTTWVEAHPGESTVIGAVGLIGVLWLLGFFSSTPAQSSGDPLAAAYYAAEKQQAVVAGQIQQTTIQAASATAIAGIQANAAVGINAANTSTAAIINAQNTDAVQNITYSNNAAVIATNQSNNNAITTINQSNNIAHNVNTLLGITLPTEIANHTWVGALDVPGLGLFQSTNNIQWNDPVQLAAQGYTPLQAAEILGVSNG